MHYSKISVFLLFSILYVCRPDCMSQEPAANSYPTIQSGFIWSSTVPDGKQAYVAFRKTFDLQEVSTPAILKLFADSRYLLWINGQYVLRGPCRFNPKRPEYDLVNVQSFLKKGRNVIVVLAHNYGNAINGRIMKHVPGITAMLEMEGSEILRTDSSWRYNNQTMYLPSPESWNTVPDIIDTRIDTGEWISADYNDAAWLHAKAIDGNLWGKMYPREIPLPKETELEKIKILPSGDLLSKVLPVELSSGQEMLIDFGQMAMAYTSMELEAMEGSRLTMKYALRYKNGKPAEMYGAGNVVTTRAGSQSFITTDQWGSHYMLVKCESGHVKINRIKITDRRYPFERIGTFSCSDTVLSSLWEMAVNTIEVTSDDAYGSDARERNEWLQDPAQPNFITTQVALSGPGPSGEKIYSDPRLLRNILRHSALSQLPNGQLLATFPTDRGPEDCHYVIDDYSCQWVEALKIYYDATGDTEFVREMWPSLMAQMSWFLSNMTTRGLLLAREYTSFDNPFAYITCEGATMNAFFYRALNDSKYLAGVVRDKTNTDLYNRAAEELKISYNKQFWNETEGAYNSAYLRDTIYAPTVHAQLIALNRGLVPENREAAVRKWFLANFKNPGMFHCCSNPDYKKMVDCKAGIYMPVVYYWAFQELYRMNKEQMDQEVINEIRRRWTPMVLFQEDAGTVDETFTDEKGEGTTESCHNYGAVPAWFLSSYMLGVRLNGPVWDKKLLIEPRLGDLTFAEGIVVTAFGPVPVMWRKSDEGRSLNFKISIPLGIQTEIRFPKLSANSTLILNNEVLMENGKPKKGIKTDERWVIVQNLSGESTGSIHAN
jgi:alpha-L-rhamnosidase